MNWHLRLCIGLVALLLLVRVSGPAAAGQFSVVDADENEIEVTVLPADGSVLTIFFLDQDQPWSGFRTFSQAMTEAGVEVWQVDLLHSYFLPEGGENKRMLPGTGIEALLDEAMKRSSKIVLLMAYDRMAIPVVRGAQAWQIGHPNDRQLGGALLLSPNFFSPKPPAGEEPELDPLVSSLQIPMVVVQPEAGVHHWRMGRLMQAFWQVGAPAHGLVLPDVGDWFFLDDYVGGKTEMDAMRHLVTIQPEIARLLASYTSKSVIEIPSPQIRELRVPGLIPLVSPRPAPPLRLSDTRNVRRALDDYEGRITLVNFWATWCPPCVEEIPSMNRLAGRYAEADFSIISVDFRESADSVNEFMKEVAVDFPVLLDIQGRASQDWSVFAFPSSFLVDRNGLIRYSVNSAIAWDQEEIFQIIDGMVKEGYSERADSGSLCIVGSNC